MSLQELSADAGLVACWLLTLNLLLGLLLSVRYNPWTHWPHKRFNYFRIHNWTGYLALAVAALHPLLLPLDATTKFGFGDLLYPLSSPVQPTINTLGALGLWLTAFVVLTSYVRARMTRSTWKALHYVAYGAAACFYVHGLLADPHLKGDPIDWIDAEKVSVELSLLLVAATSVWRLRWGLRHPRRGERRVPELAPGEPAR